MSAGLAARKLGNSGSNPGSEWAVSAVLDDLVYVCNISCFHYSIVYFAEQVCLWSFAIWFIPCGHFAVLLGFWPYCMISYIYFFFLMSRIFTCRPEGHFHDSSNCNLSDTRIFLELSYHDRWNLVKIKYNFQWLMSPENHWFKCNDVKNQGCFKWEYNERIEVIILVVIVKCLVIFPTDKKHDRYGIISVRIHYFCYVYWFQFMWMW